MELNRAAIADAEAKATVLAHFERRRVQGRIAALVRAVTPPRHDAATLTLIRHISTTALEGHQGGRILFFSELGTRLKTRTA